MNTNEETKTPTNKYEIGEWQAGEPVWDRISIGGRCGQCQYYLFIDSGYGYCRRFPPGTIPMPLLQIQTVEWSRTPCGEFQSLTLNK